MQDSRLHGMTAQHKLSWRYGEQRRGSTWWLYWIRERTWQAKWGRDFPRFPVQGARMPWGNKHWRRNRAKITSFLYLTIKARKMAWPLQVTVGLLRSYQFFLSFPYAISPPHFLLQKKMCSSKTKLFHVWVAGTVGPEYHYSDLTWIYLYPAKFYPFSATRSWPTP